MSKAKKPGEKETQPELPDPASSPGENPAVVTPKDVGPDAATARDVRPLPVRSPDPEERENALLDEAIEETFPASDPIAIPSYDEQKKKQEQDKAANSGSRS